MHYTSAQEQDLTRSLQSITAALCYDVHTGNSDGFRNAVQAAESFPTTPSSLSDMPSTRTEQTTIKPSRDQQFQHTLNNNSRSSTSPRNAETKYRLTSPINQQVSKPLSNNTEDKTCAGRYDNSQYGLKVVITQHSQFCVDLLYKA